MDYIRQEPLPNDDMNYKMLVHFSLKIGAIALNASEPFKWASGYRMPIYNDNRMLLGKYICRKLTTDGFSEIIRNNGIEFDYVLGTSLAGIAPASSLAIEHKKPLIMISEGQAFRLDDHFDYKEPHWKYVDVIASTAPWGIANGVNIANKLEKPFVYVRPAKKDHGKQKQVEGILLPGQKVALLNIYAGEENNYEKNAMDAIREAGGTFSSFTDLDIKGIKPVDIKDKRILVIEDLISTGGSSAKEVVAARNLGARADNLISIFTYNLDEARSQFDNLVPGCHTNSILTYENLLEEAVKMGYLKYEDRKLLEEWRADPFNWGEKHGFPKVEKK